MQSIAKMNTSVCDNNEWSSTVLVVFFDLAAVERTGGLLAFCGAVFALATVDVFFLVVVFFAAISLPSVLR